MTTWGESTTLNELEATMWRAERHPQNSTQGGVLQIFAETPNWEAPALDFFSLLLPILNRAPASMLTPLFISMQNRADLTVSNVPGMPYPVRFLGAPVEAMYYFGPLPGSPVMVVLHSQNGRCFIGINCDGEVFPEPQRLFDDLQEGLDEVLALTKWSKTTTKETV
jgi:hypothetical protein